MSTKTKINEESLIKTIQRKGTECEEMQELIQVYHEDIETLARHYQNNEVFTSHLITAAKEAMKRAVLKYPFNHKVQFEDYVFWWIEQAILKRLLHSETNAHKLLFCEKMKSLYESAARENNTTAECLVVFGNVDYDSCPIVQEYQEKGYKLSDANAFGVSAETDSDIEIRGEVLTFTKIDSNK